MNLRTFAPNAIPMNVAMAIPNIPARIPGTINEFHPFAVAIPAAVVGPPTLAFDAKSSNLSSMLSSFPTLNMIARCVPIWTKANKNMLGAVLITLHMFPLAPITVKNT